MSGPRPAATNQTPPDHPLPPAADLYRFNEGTHVRLWEHLGAHPVVAGGVEGTYFAVWAPNAHAVSVSGDFNGWAPQMHPRSPRATSGIWEGFVEGVSNGSVYKFH